MAETGAQARVLAHHERSKHRLNDYAAGSFALSAWKKLGPDRWALRYAAALPGWRVRELGLGHGEQAALMGLDRAGDFRSAESEEAEAGLIGQVLYHFSVGLPVQDARIASTPPYPEPRP